LINCFGDFLTGVRRSLSFQAVISNHRIGDLVSKMIVSIINAAPCGFTAARYSRLSNRDLCDRPFLISLMLRATA